MPRMLKALGMMTIEGAFMPPPGERVVSKRIPVFPSTASEPYRRWRKVRNRMQKQSRKVNR